MLLSGTTELSQVNRQIIRPNEEAILARLVDVMVALELRFLRDKNEDGQLVYRLDPCVLSDAQSNTSPADAPQQARGCVCNLRWQASVGYRSLEVCR